jgi:uncharacterized protein (DUF427 family)
MEVSMRTRIQIACALLAFALTSGIARAASANGADYSRSELKKTVRNAHTAEQYRVLASYYRMRQQQFTDQAHDEIVWFARRSMNVSLPAAKYPTPLNSSRNRYEYFNYEAQRMSQQAAHYESLSASVAQ